MRLFIAEKKDVAAAISDAMGGKAGDGHFFEVGDSKITWLSGHFLRLQDPEEYDESRYKRWTLDSLPMTWPIKQVPDEKSVASLNKVLNLINQADELVQAADPDDAGQLIGDEVINYSGFKGKVLRLLINDNNKSAILKSLEQMKPNEDFKGLSDSALARTVADQRYGYNLTRAYTLKGREKGLDSVLSSGRVQSCLLGMVVSRDRLRKEHKLHVYFVVEALALINGVSFKAAYQVKGGDIADDKNRLTDKTQAQAIADRTKEGALTVLTASTEDKKTDPPMPYSLIKLQADCAGKWNYSPKRVLEITQRLRDNYKAITYNRSDSEGLNEERHEEGTGMLQALSGTFDATKGADPTIKSKAFNDKLVTAHHAIIPTFSVPSMSDLSEEEARVYSLIAKRYIAQFYPPATYKITTVSLESPSGDLFQGKGRLDVSQGWKAVYSDETNEDDESESEAIVNLESLNKGDEGIANKCDALEKRTKPPQHYTMKTLLMDMTRVARYVEDPEIKKLLLKKDSGKKNESGGIGTPATRDSHIETIFKRGYVGEEGKYIVSTHLGNEFYDSLPDFARKPDLTALWYERLLSVENGTIDLSEFLREVDQSIDAEVKRVKTDGLNIKAVGHSCPKCDDGILRRRKGSNGFFWGCGSYPTCSATFKDKAGKPDTSPKKEKAPVEVSEHKCPECEKGLVRRPAKKKGVFWWGCSGFPSCKFTTFDNNGEPKKK